METNHKEYIFITYKAFKTLEQSITLFVEHQRHKTDQIFLAMRDSMIKRFNYCIELFWKVLKFYLQDVELFEEKLLTPRGIIRDAVTAKIITEAEGDKCIEMVKKRNETSHIYHEDIAEVISEDIPQFYTLMHTIINRVARKI